eukprot:TRINITY_DN19096_c0_g1_i1.p1 TRINITY_DN19096_c0_g1~~TRINITY_DN19096_c0_g1_i1.p1  ORF type:complete len:378 (-),score=104.61 TRINITY_DN19096_c0_g1_i1:74-1207(-)
MACAVDGTADSATAAETAAATAEELAEFHDAPAPGLSLFVQSTWAAGLPLRLPSAESGSALLCRILACDGERCWEGSLRRSDLAGPLGDSWSDPSNLRLLLDALAARREGGAALPSSEAVWGCGDGRHAHLELSVRFLFREGPVVAIRGVRLAPASLGAGLSRLFALAHGAQTAASACVGAADAECAALQQRREALQRQLQALPGELEMEERRLLAEMVEVLNNQKRRCRDVWKQTRREAGFADDAANEEAVPGAVPSLEALQEGQPGGSAVAKEEVAKREEVAKEEDFDDDVMSLVFATQPSGPPGASVKEDADAAAAAAAARAQENSAFTFTIPLTLGMDDSLLDGGKGRVKRQQPDEAFSSTPAVRQKLEPVYT